MTDNELLLAIADIMDKKIKSELQAELQPLKGDIRDIKLHLENVTDKNVAFIIS
ncbi:MAG: hypothetical protein NC392_15290 [Roseburia sp.]|nr:hypothetical protein [Roseburia sp.]